MKAIASMRPEKGSSQVDAFLKVVSRALHGADEKHAADRHQVVVHIDQEVLSGGEGRAEIEGTGVSP